MWCKQNMSITYSEYISKLSACYLGKAIGGTLGMPFEGDTGINTIDYYTPVPEEMCGNDDIDLQVVWIETITKKGFPINRKELSDAWKHLNFGPDEYSVALHNIRNGIYAPLSGIFGNKFGDGMGAAIRSEFWAAITPSNPDLATKLAFEDACVDHFGSGISGCQFLAAIESAAYTESNLNNLIEIGLSYTKHDIRFTSAIRDTIDWWNNTNDLFAVRKNILEKYHSDIWSDVTINTCFIVLALLAGNGDFGKSICYATNLGYDADCTAASVGALLGILNPDSIDEKWIAPIGNSLVLSPQILGLHTENTILELCSKISSIMSRCQDYYKPQNIVKDIPLDIIKTGTDIPIWCESPHVISQSDFPNRESLIALTPLTINLIYPKNISLTYNEALPFSAIITNPTRNHLEIELNLSVPKSFSLYQDKHKFALDAFCSHTINFEIKSESSYKSAFDFLDMSFNINGIPFNTSAGIIRPYPWVVTDNVLNENNLEKTTPDNAVFSPAPSFVSSISKGKKTMAIELRPAMPQQVAFTCQGTRPLKLFLNGENVLNYNAKSYAPALHRGQSVLVNLRSIWNKVTIQVEDGDEGEVFFALGNPVDWIWLNTIEWRQPQ